LQASLPHAIVASPDQLISGIPPTPRHNLRYHGGKTIANLTFTNFYVGGQEAWQVKDIQNVDLALAAAMADKNLNNVMMQYFNNAAITSVFKPSQVLPGPKPVTFSQGDVESLIGQLHLQGKLDGFDLGSTVFNFMLPSGSVLTTDTTPSHTAAAELVRSARNPAKPEADDDSMHGLGGYHGSVHVSATITVYYAIGTYSEKLASGEDNGIVAFDQSWKNIVATFYHELNEARTDADVEDAIRAGNDPSGMKFLGWMSDQGEECGDFPVSEAGEDLSRVMQEVPLADGSGVVPIQIMYSNAVKGPEGPIPAPHPLTTHQPAAPAAAVTASLEPLPS